MTGRPATRGILVRRRTVVGSLLAVAIVAPLAYWGWRALQPRDELLLNCSVAAPRVAGIASPGVMTFRPSARVAAGFAVSYTEGFDLGQRGSLAWKSDRPGLRALFLYESTVALADREPTAANKVGEVDFWWNELIPTAGTSGWSDDGPWSKTIDDLGPGRYCLTILETAGSDADWTVTVTNNP